MGACAFWFDAVNGLVSGRRRSTSKENHFNIPQGAGLQANGGRLQKSTLILLVEDFEPYRDFVKSLLDGNPAWRPICEASDGLVAVEKAQQLNPHLILMDIALPRLDGLEAARRIRELVPSSKIVFLTQETSAEVVREALSLGAWGYIVKQQTGADLLAAVAAILGGKRFFSPALDLHGIALAKGADGAN